MIKQRKSKTFFRYIFLFDQFTFYQLLKTTRTTTKIRGRSQKAEK